MKLLLHHLVVAEGIAAARLLHDGAEPSIFESASPGRRLPSLSGQQADAKPGCHPLPGWELASFCRPMDLHLGARTLLGAPGIATRNKKLLGAKGIATRSKDY